MSLRTPYVDPENLDYSLLGGAESLGPADARVAAGLGSASDAASAVSAASSESDVLTSHSLGASSSASIGSDAGISTESSSASLSPHRAERDGSSTSSPTFSPSLPLPGARWYPNKVSQDPSDWLWLLTEEPHRTRRQAILKDHPEIKKLMGHDPRTKYIALSVVALQLTVAYLLRHTPFFSWTFFAVAYVIGGTANQNIFLAVHEITHNLAFRGVKANRLLAIVTNIPIGVPFAMMFKRYHIEHHKYLGEDGIDTDLPSKLELIVLRSILGKAFFASFQIFFYALRPGFIRYQQPTVWVLGNIVFQLAVDTLIVKTMGWNSLLYLLLSSHMAGSLHPLAGHFIAEHYLFDQYDQETWSYYGWLNVFCYNVGYHNEHHDFPSVSWSRLPELRRIAHKYYDPLPCHKSWPMVTVRFIFDPSVGLFSRVKRRNKNATPDEGGGGKDGLAGGLKDD